MSVLMHGVDMPKNCEECNFKGECRNYWDKIREAYTRPSWCPLEEIADTPQTKKTCDNCGQDRNLCQYCIEEDRMWIPKQMRTLYEGDIKVTPQTDCAWK